MTDFNITDHGSIMLLTTVSEAAKEWVNKHLPEERLTWGPNSTAVEPRYMQEIVNGIWKDELTVSLDGEPICADP